jgi:hypothetical protein
VTCAATAVKRHIRAGLLRQVKLEGMSKMKLRDFSEADAQQVNRLALAAFDHFKTEYSDWSYGSAATLNWIVKEKKIAPPHDRSGPRRRDTSLSCEDL